MLQDNSVTEIFLTSILTHKGIIIRICKFYCHDLDDQKDLYQDIILNAWSAYPRFERRSKFSTWLYRVALNTALHRKRKNRMLNNMTDLDSVFNISNEESTDSQLDVLLSVIDQLDPLEKSIILLYLDDLSYKEISEITGLTENNIGVKLHRIKENIKVKLF